MTKFLMMAAALVSFHAFADDFAAVELKAAEEKALIKELESIADQAAVANGGTELNAYNAEWEFDMDAALKSIAIERPDVFGTKDNGDDDRTDLKHSFKTKIGRTDAIAFLKGSEFAEMIGGENDGVGEGLQDLHDRGLIRAILHRSTDHIYRDTWLIPEVFDIYVEYTRQGKLKGQFLRLHYELGD